MTPNEYRKKHKRCATCVYWTPEFTDHFAECESGKCAVKNISKCDYEGRFCRIYEARSFKL